MMVCKGNLTFQASAHAEVGVHSLDCSKIATLDEHFRGTFDEKKLINDTL